LAQTLAAAREPWATLFRLAAVVGGRESELLALWWENPLSADPTRATTSFTHQVDRRGNRVPLKTEESKATLPLPRATALMLLEHKARCSHKRARSTLRCPSGRPNFVAKTSERGPVNAEEARDLLRHRNSNVTRTIYRAHFEDKRREQLRARMEARMDASGRT
jgi:integrase